MRGNRLILWFGLVLALACYSRWQVRDARGQHCSLDGTRIVKAFQVDLVVDGKVRETFCAVKCAQDWPAVPRGAQWRVRDEITGKLLDATKACYVESKVPTVASRGEGIHVFQDWTSALGHVRQHQGRRIPNPFATEDRLSAEPLKTIEATDH